MKNKKRFIVEGYVQKAVYIQVEAKNEREALRKARQADIMDWEEGNWESEIINMQVVEEYER